MRAFCGNAVQRSLLQMSAWQSRSSGTLLYPAITGLDLASYQVLLSFCSQQE
jgi:hypothetical protein